MVLRGTLDNSGKIIFLKSRLACAKQLFYSCVLANKAAIPVFYGAIDMALAQEDLIQIQKLIDHSIAARQEVVNANVRYELELRERIVRVEEELKHQRELMMQGFDMTQKRFEQIDKHLEQMSFDTSKRFEQVDKRFEHMDKHLTAITYPTHGSVYVLVSRFNHIRRYRYR